MEGDQKLQQSGTLEIETSYRVSDMRRHGIHSLLSVVYVFWIQDASQLVFVKLPPLQYKQPSAVVITKQIWASMISNQLQSLWKSWHLLKIPSIKVGSNGLGAFGSCPIPDVNFLFFFFFFFLTGPKGDNEPVADHRNSIQMNFRFKETNRIVPVQRGREKN